MTEQIVTIAHQGYQTKLPRIEEIRSRLHNPSFALAVSCAITLAFLPAVGLILAATAWLFWNVISGAIGGFSTSLALFGLVTCAVILSRRTGQSFVSSLIVAGFGGITLLFAALYAVAGYALVLR